MSAIVIDNISKDYAGVSAIKNIAFTVEPGELFGLIGPDGAGKTTLFKILVTLMLPNQGQATILGQDLVKDYRALRKRIGYMPGKFSLYPDLSIEENLNFFASVFGTTLEKNYDLIKDIYQQIEPFKKRRAGQLSGGMKQKLALCCSLIHKPEALFLDEPTTGVDAVSRKEFWEMLAQLQQHGLTILVSTPYMDEADRCDRIALIQEGSIMGVDTPHGIASRFPLPLFAVKSADMYRLLQDLRAAPFAQSCFTFGEYLHLAGIDAQLEPVEISNYLQSHRHQQVDIKPISAGIEDSFMYLMSNKHD
jgi:ABC-type multidrug transport system ATPase subunit